METVILCVEMESCIRMAGVSSSVARVRRNVTENVFQSVVMELCYKMENVFLSVRMTRVVVTENVVHQDRHTNVSVMMDIAEIDVNVVQDSEYTETNVSILMNVTRSSLARSSATTRSDPISATAGTDFSRFPAVRMFAKISMNVT